MQLHRNARTTPRGRREIVRRLEQGERAVDVAEAVGVSARTVYKWGRRYREEGVAGLEDRSSAPRRVRHRTSAARARQIVELRRKRRTGWQIAERLRMAPSTVYTVLRREGLERLSMLEPKPAVRRYEYAQPGELVHLDTKPLSRIGRVGHRIHGDRSRRVRGIGWEYAHVAIDDASRLAYVEILPDQKGDTAVAFFARAKRWFARRRISIARVLTDNGSRYVSRHFRQALKRQEIRHLRTRPYRPQSRVGCWRGAGRWRIAGAPRFRWECLTIATVGPFPAPARRTVHADLPHTAPVRDLMPSFSAGPFAAWAA
jgi:transposase